VIEWYFDPKGRSLALDYFEALNNEEQIKSLGLLMWAKLKIKINLIMRVTKFMHLNLSLTDFYVFSFQEVKLLLLMHVIRKRKSCLFVRSRGIKVQRRL
jgi:hypothetical protein